MRYRFLHCESGIGLSAGLKPIIERVFCQARFCAVQGKQSWLRCYSFRELTFQHHDYTSMQLVAPATDQSAVGGILHQGVLERVFRTWRCSTPQNQPGIQELRQGVIQFLPRYPCDCADELVRERAPERGSNLS